jgi:hypothetical protein
MARKPRIHCTETDKAVMWHRPCTFCLTAFNDVNEGV